MADLRRWATSKWPALRSAVGAQRPLHVETTENSSSLSERLPLYQQDDHEVTVGSASPSERTVRFAAVAFCPSAGLHHAQSCGRRRRGRATSERLLSAALTGATS